MNPFFFLYAWLTCANFVIIGYTIYIMTTLETLKSKKKSFLYLHVILVSKDRQVSFWKQHLWDESILI